MPDYNINVAFSRELLRSVLAEVRERFPLICARSAWVYRVGRDQFEFHGPDKFYNGAISASNAYEARAKGWESFLRDADRKLERAAKADLAAIAAERENGIILSIERELGHTDGAL